MRKPVMTTAEPRVRHRCLVACLVVMLVHQGCAAFRDSSLTPAETAEPKIRKIAVVAAHFSPNPRFNTIAAGGKPKPAADTAREEAPGANWDRMTAALSCTRLIYSCPPAAPASGADRAEAENKDRVSGEIAHPPLLVQVLLKEQVLAYARDNVSQMFVPVSEPAPSSPGAIVDYGRLAREGIDAVLELQVTHLDMLRFGSSMESGVGFSMTAQAKLINVRNEKIFTERTYLILSPSRPVSVWMQDHATPLRAMLENAYRDMAEIIVDEAFLFHPSMILSQWGLQEGDAYGSATFEDSGPARPYYGPAYTLRPDYPNLSGRVDSLEPTLRWQAFPRAGDLEAVKPASDWPVDMSSSIQWVKGIFGSPQTDTGAPGGDSSRPDNAKARGAITNVRYELRIFESVRARDYYGHGKLLYSVRDLRKPFHKPAISLKPCTTYFWSVRARYDLDGRKRVTPWAIADQPPPVPPPPPASPAEGAAAMAILPLYAVISPVAAAAAVATAVPAGIMLGISGSADVLRNYPYAFQTPCPAAGATAH